MRDALVHPVIVPRASSRRADIRQRAFRPLRRGDTPTYGPADFGVPFAAGYFPKAAQIVSGANHACVLSDHVLCWETISKRPPISGASVVEPPDGSAFTQIAAGDDHTCGATT